MSAQRILGEPTRIITNYVIGTPRNLLLGVGLAYAIERKEYLDVPIILLFPSVYAGYHLYTERNTVAEWIRQKRRWTWR
jgi:hypothetical protein